MKSDFANLKRYASENIKLHNSSNNGNRIVFFGDSITEFWTKRNATIFQDPNHINRGISGQTTSQMVLRFQNDVIELHPETVVILAGINDIAENTGPISIEAIFQNIITITGQALANHIKVILCSVLPSNTITWKTSVAPSDKIIQLNQLLSAYAENHKITFVDYYNVMVNKSKGLDSKYTDDGVHPNIEGYKVMEEIITPVLNS
jgi:lysophospholipase L1-like esterase